MVVTSHILLGHTEPPEHSTEEKKTQEPEEGSVRPRLRDKIADVSFLGPRGAPMASGIVPAPRSRSVGGVALFMVLLKQPS